MNRETTQPGLLTHHFSVQLSPTPRAARLARLLAVEQLRSWDLHLDLDAAAHVVAELAANAVTHGRLPGRDFRLVMYVAGDTLRIEVTDTRSDRLPQVTIPGGESGRGLVLVDALAQRWGVSEGRAPRKTVWAELELVRPPWHGNPYAGAGGDKRQRND